MPRATGKILNRPGLFAYVLSGTYFTGPFALAGNVALHLEMSALLKDSEDFTNYALARGRG